MAFISWFCYINLHCTGDVHACLMSHFVHIISMIKISLKFEKTEIKQQRWSGGVLLLYCSSDYSDHFPGKGDGQKKKLEKKKKKSAQK